METTPTQLELKDRMAEMPFSPKSPQDLKNALIVNGVWDKTAYESDGYTPIVWNDAKADKLYEDFASGEREFVISSYKSHTGKVATRFETIVNVVGAQVFFNPHGGDAERLAQYMAYKTDTLGTDGKPTSEVVSGLIPRKEKTSISGKVRTVEKTDPSVRLHHEMHEELGLEQEKYTVAPEHTQRTEESYSFGFPGLWSRFAFSDYEIEIKPKGYEKQYMEVGKTTQVGNVRTTRLNVFKWEKVTPSKPTT